MEDRSWIPQFTVDSYTGADFAWAWNAPLMQLGGFLLTAGRATFMTLAGLLLAYASGSQVLLYLTLGYVGTIISLIRLMTWPQPPAEESAAPVVP